VALMQMILKKNSNRPDKERFQVSLELKEKGNRFYERGLKKLGFDNYFYATKFLKYRTRELNVLPQDLKNSIQELRCNLLRNVAAFYYTEKMWEQVIQYCSQALEIKGNCIISLSKRAGAYSMIERFTEADADLQKALQLDTDHNHELLLKNCQDIYNKHYHQYSIRAKEMQLQMSKGIV